MRFLSEIALAALLSCVASCGVSEIRWSLPPSFTDAQRVTFSRSLGRWNAVATTQQSIGEGDRRIVIRDRDEMQNCNANAETNGVEMRLPADFSEASLMHEFGHALGLGHHAGPGVMAASATTAELNEADREECRRVEACDE